MAGRIRNVGIVVAVAALVIGVAWFKESRRPDETTPVTSAPAANLPRLVDVGSTTCDACKRLAPVLDELRREYEGRVIVDFIDSYKHPSAKLLYDVRAIPTLILFNADDEEVWRQEGFVSKENLIARFAQVGVK